MTFPFCLRLIGNSSATFAEIQEFSTRKGVDVASYLWFVPGFMGSTLGLYNVDATGRPVGGRQASLWGDLPSISSLPLVEFLQLPTTVVAPQAIVADGLCPTELGGYTRFIASLANVLPKPFQLAPWPYDWRQSARDLGNALALALVNSANQGNANYVVAHSFGSLVTWCAWASLVDQQQQKALTRIITMGGALYGASATPGIFRELEPSLGTLVILQRFMTPIGGATAPLSLILSPTDSQVAQLIQLASTWPSVYDLYPDFAGLDDPGDTLRGLLFLSDPWAAALVQPNFALMQTEVTRVHQYVRQAKYVPDPSMSAHIIGGAYNTPYRVQESSASQLPPGAAAPAYPAIPARLARLMRLPSWSTTFAGDARCTVAQATWPGHYFTSVNSEHAAMQDDPETLTAILSMLQMVFPLPAAGSPVAQAPVYIPPKAQTQLTQADASRLLLEGVPETAVSGTMVPQPVLNPPPAVLPVRTGVDP